MVDGIKLRIRIKLHAFTAISGITGGVPHYINKLGVQDDLNEALLENLFDSSGYLFEEPENLLKQELREPGVYNSIITAIAEGASKLNEIATKTQISTGPCSKYLKVLTELGIIRKDTPVTEKPGKRTAGGRCIPVPLCDMIKGRI